MTGYDGSPSTILFPFQIAPCMLQMGTPRLAGEQQQQRAHPRQLLRMDLAGHRCVLDGKDDRLKMSHEKRTGDRRSFGVDCPWKSVNDDISCFLRAFLSLCILHRRRPHVVLVSWCDDQFLSSKTKSTGYLPIDSHSYFTRRFLLKMSAVPCRSILCPCFPHEGEPAHVLIPVRENESIHQPPNPCTSKGHSLRTPTAVVVFKVVRFWRSRSRMLLSWISTHDCRRLISSVQFAHRGRPAFILGGNIGLRL